MLDKKKFSTKKQPFDIILKFITLFLHFNFTYLIPKTKIKNSKYLNLIEAQKYLNFKIKKPSKNCNACFKVSKLKFFRPEIQYLLHQLNPKQINSQIY